MTLRDGGSAPADRFEDRGFLLGDGLFETVRLYGDMPFRLKQHLDRLRAGALRVGIPVPDRLDAEVSSALEGWAEERPREAAAGALRITLTRGAGAGLLPPEAKPPTLVVTVSPYVPDPGIQAQGLKAVLRGRVDENALTAGLKQIGYLERIVALREARRAGADEALLLNSRGAVIEGSASNLFLVRDDVLHTPAVAEGALAGITREVVLECAAEAGIETRERALPAGSLAGVEELFLTSSLRELAPVVEVEGERVGSGGPGAVFRLLHERFRKTVRRAGDVRRTG